MDAKASIKVGAFSRGGYSRSNTRACDHDFAPDCILKLFGINSPSLDENYMYFTESFITPDFMIDALENHWNGELFDSVDKVLGLCKTMCWRGKAPVVKIISGIYAKGVTLAPKAMKKLELFLIRTPGIEKWAVDILAYIVNDRCGIILFCAPNCYKDANVKHVYGDGCQVYAYARAGES